jgi:phosphatidylserine decarboxylase
MLYDLAKQKFTISLFIGAILYFFEFNSLAFIVFGYSVVILYLYRQKKRYNLFNDKAIHIPIDGKIIAIDKLENSICVSIENGIFDLGNILAPINAEKIEVKKINGLNYSLFSRHSNILNEKIKYVFYKDNHTIKMTAICSFMPNSLYKDEFKKVTNGDIMGHTILGLINIYIPNTCTLKIDIGDNVKARSILGYF